MLRFLFFLVVLFSYSDLLAKNRLSLAYVDFSPYEYRNQDGEAEGILIDRVRDLFCKIDVEIELVHLSFAYAYIMVKKGKLDGLFNFYKTEEREKFFDYSDPIVENELMVFSLKDSYMGVDSVDDLAGIRVGVVRGYSYGEHFDAKRGFFKDDADSHLLNFRKLLFRRIDVYICDRLVGERIIRDNDWFGRFAISSQPLAVVPGYIGFTKGRHGNIIQKVNAVLRDQDLKIQLE